MILKKTNGSTITLPLENINIGNESITLNLYENLYEQRNNLFIIENKKFELLQLLKNTNASGFTLEIELQSAILKHLQITIYTDYEFSNLSENWVFENRPKAVILTDSKFSEAFSEQGDLWNIIQAVSGLIPAIYKQRFDGYYLIYLEYITPEDEAILNNNNVPILNKN